jgi:hypothetical protein
MAVAVVATLVAAALALALVAGSPRSAAPAAPAVVVLHQDQTHAAQERNDIIATQSAASSPSVPLAPDSSH